MWKETWTDKLKKKLFLKYDKFARPSEHYQTTKVYFDLVIRHVDVNEFENTVTVIGWARNFWTDNKLQWNREDYGNLSEIHVGNHEIWQPDVVLYNSGTAHTVEHYGEAHCIVRSNGSVIWVPPVRFVALCDLDLRLWPFDTQECNLKIGSWTFHAGQIDLRFWPKHESEAKEILENTEWNLLSVSRTRSEDTYPCCEENYISLTLGLTLKRNSALYYSILTTPAAAVVFLTLATFWLSPQSEMKVTLAACTTLIITVFLIYFGITVPRTPSPPLIVYFYSGCLCQVTISLILSVFILNISRRPFCKPLPRNIRVFLMSWPGKLLGLSDLISVIESRKPVPSQELRGKLTEEFSTNSTSNIAEDCDKQNMILPSKNATQLEWILAGTAVDRIAFIIFCFILGTMAVICMS